MNLTVKTLKGGKFTIEVDPSNTVAEIKNVIENTKSELPAAGMKLIHSGKVLKDNEKIESCNIKPNDFLVVMIAKAKKAASKPAASAPKTPATTSGNPPTPSAPVSSSSSGGTATASAVAPAVPTPSAAAASSSSSNEFPVEVVNNLKALGFPDGMVIACLRASNGNPDVAVEFLMNGIPPGIGDGGSAPPPAAASGGASSPVSSSGNGLDALRSHPQFDALRRLVQSNPSSLQAVLAQIGQQQPELLQAINANQAAFLEMMNEPVVDAPAAPAPANATSSSGGAGGPFGGLPGMDMNPAALAGMLQQMPPADQAAMAQMMGVDVTQLQQIAQMIGAMPPEQLAQFSQMAQAGMGGMPGMPPGAGGGGGPQVLRLSDDEMAAVNRLTEMGFDRTEAAQAYLACDKNEALAANLLMDGGFGGTFGDDHGDSGDGDNNEDMYD